MIAYKFSETATADQPDVTAQELVELMKSGARYTFGVDNLKSYGIYKIHGWAFDMRDQLKHYVVKQYGSWYEVYAPNITSLRKLTFGRIDNIKEI